MPQKSSRQTRRRVKHVRFDLFAPEANKVALAGDFNGWDITSLPMKEDRKGTWKTSVALEPGRYEYRFWVDGVWQDDPGAQDRVANPFGCQNCVRTVD